MNDEQTGLSIRFIREYKPSNEQIWTTADQAIVLAMQDDRDIPFSQKLVEALAFLKSRIH